MTPFERHNIGHLSASSINLFCAQQSLWVCEKLLGKKMPSGVAASRGLAVEHGIHAGLVDPTLPVEHAIGEANMAYDQATRFDDPDKREAERKKIPGYVTNGLAEIRQYGIPSEYQRRIELTLDGCPVPIIGFIDWVFGSHGILVDLKTSERLPGDIKDGHGRQGAIYATAVANHAMRFLFVRPVTKPRGEEPTVKVFEMTAQEIAAHIQSVQRIVGRMQRFLSLSTDPLELAQLCAPPDYESFYWNSATAREMGREVFGF